MGFWENLRNATREMGEFEPPTQTQLSDNPDMKPSDLVSGIGLNNLMNAWAALTPPAEIPSPDGGEPIRFMPMVSSWRKPSLEYLTKRKAIEDASSAAIGKYISSKSTYPRSWDRLRYDPKIGRAVPGDVAAIIRRDMALDDIALAEKMSDSEKRAMRMLENFDPATAEAMMEYGLGLPERRVHLKNQVRRIKEHAKSLSFPSQKKMMTRYSPEEIEAVQDSYRAKMKFRQGMPYKEESFKFLLDQLEKYYGKR